MRPAFSLPLSTALALLLAGLAFALWQGLRDRSPAAPPRPPLLAASAARESAAAREIGVYLYAEDALSPAAERLARIGAQWTRTWFSWDDVEPVRTDPPTYHWQQMDQVLLSLVRAGFEPIFLLGGNARWAADSSCGPLHAHAQADFQRFLRDLVTRYSAPPYDIHVWEIYNEPDSVFGAQGYCFGTRGALYADSLRLAYEAIKSVDPTALVMFGGISYDFFLDEGGSFDPAFLDDALAAGAGPYFDLFAFHYYPAFAERWNAFGPGVAGKAAYLRSELARFGLDKPLALTEIGRPTHGPPSDPASYSQALTTRFVAEALTLARVADLSPILWFTAVDKPDEPYQYGLYAAGYQPQPSFFAYRALLAALQGGSYAGVLPVQGQGQAHSFDHAGWRAIIVWAETGEVHLTAPGPWIWQVDSQGAARILYDGGRGDRDQTRNGVIALAVAADPMLFWLPAHD